MYFKDKIKLQLPPTLRPPFPNEIPSNSGAQARLAELANANIVEGYVIKENEKKELPFNFYAEINIDNSKLWNLFLTLSEQLPEIVSCIYSFNRGEAKFGNYLPKEAVVDRLSKFELELVQDCFLEFGLIFHDDDILIEVFVDESKYIKFWGRDENIFIQVMKKFDLEHFPQLNFIDEYPKISERLGAFNSNARDTAEVIAQLDYYFQE